MSRTKIHFVIKILITIAIGGLISGTFDAFYRHYHFELLNVLADIPTFMSGLIVGTILGDKNEH